MRVDDGFVLREIAGDYVIIPTGKTVLDFNGMITVNEVGVSIWKMLQEETTFENIVKGILDEYDADEETVKADASAGSWRKMGCVYPRENSMRLPLLLT